MSCNLFSSLKTNYSFSKPDNLDHLQILVRIQHVFSEVISLLIHCQTIYFLCIQEFKSQTMNLVECLFVFMVLYNKAFCQHHELRTQMYIVKSPHCIQYLVCYLFLIQLCLIWESAESKCWTHFLFFFLDHYFVCNYTWNKCLSVSFFS